MGAMLEAVWRHGYRDTTLGEVVALAGVSKSTFYAQFGSKQECFLATFDEIIGQATDQVGRAYRSQAELPERIRAALETFVEIVIAEPAAASLVVVESYSLGPIGIGPREQTATAFELLVRQSFDHTPERGEVSDVTIRAIVGGIRWVVYRCLRSGKPEQLREYVDPLLRWALSYQRLASDPLRQKLSKACEVASPPDLEVDQLGADWIEPADSPTSRAMLSQRERIIRAAAQVAVADGYAALSIPAITAAAGVSNQTFYEHFTSKLDAFLTAFDDLTWIGLKASLVASMRPAEWHQGVAVGLRTMLEFISVHPLYARLAFFELPTAGPAALDRGDVTTERFTSFLNPDVLPEGVGQPLSDIVVEAIRGGMWAVVEHELARGRVESLPELVPELVYISLAPFDSL